MGILDQKPAFPPKCMLAVPDPSLAHALSRMLMDSGAKEIFPAESLCALREQAPSALPDLLLVHALLPSMEPEGLFSMLDGLHLFRHPAVIFLYPSGIRPSAQPSLCLPVTEQALKAAVSAHWPPDARESHIQRARSLLLRMGLMESAALSHLSYAAALAVSDGSCARMLSARILPRIEARFGIPRRRAADGMRRAIDQAWTTGDIERQYAFFGNTIDASRGKPTVGALIAMAAEIIRLGEDEKQL